jgi:hypothetical protein
MPKKAVSTKKRTGRASDKFMLRLPDGMRDYLADLAVRSDRSMNSLIVMALAKFCAETTTGILPDQPSWNETRAQMLNLQGAVEKLTAEVAALRAEGKRPKRGG